MINHIVSLSEMDEVPPLVVRRILVERDRQAEEHKTTA